MCQSVLVAQGAKPSSPSLEEKGKFLKLITNFLLLDSTRYVFEDFQKGMYTMGLLDCIKEHPRQFEEIFCAQEHPLDANMVDFLSGSNTQRRVLVPERNRKERLHFGAIICKTVEVLNI